MQLHAIGMGLGKTVFHLVGLSLRVEVVVRKMFWCNQLRHFTANPHADWRFGEANWGGIERLCKLDAS